MYKGHFLGEILEDVLFCAVGKTLSISTYDVFFLKKYNIVSFNTKTHRI